MTGASFFCRYCNEPIATGDLCQRCAEEREENSQRAEESHLNRDK